MKSYIQGLMTGLSLAFLLIFNGCDKVQYDNDDIVRKIRDLESQIGDIYDGIDNISSKMGYLPMIDETLSEVKFDISMIRINGVKVDESLF
jgi:hypothetical protein